MKTAIQIDIVKKEVLIEENTKYLEHIKTLTPARKVVSVDHDWSKDTKIITHEVIRYFRENYTDKHGFEKSFFIKVEDWDWLNELCHITREKSQAQIRLDASRLASQMNLEESESLRYHERKLIKQLPWYKRLFNQF